jgi:hypothetical protein
MSKAWSINLQIKGKQGIKYAKIKTAEMPKKEIMACG